MDVLSAKTREYLEKTSVAGKMLATLAREQAVGDVLIFGCGTDYFPGFVSLWFPQARVTGYDIDKEKIARVKKREMKIAQVTYTHERPTQKFQTVLASHVLHHDPKNLAAEALCFVGEQGFVGIMDYDMKGFGYADFFSRWGRTNDEKTECEKIGRAESHRVHTSFDLEDCMQLMSAKAIVTVGSEGKIKSMAGKHLPTLSFYYLGKKQ